MFREFVIKNGFVVILFLTSVVLSLDSGGESFNSNFNRFRQKIPRIGRRGEGIISEYMDSDSFPLEGSLSNFFLKASKAVPRLGRRMDLSTESSRPLTIGEKHQVDNSRIDRESDGIQIMSPKQDSWQNFGDLINQSNKEWIKPKIKIPKEFQENYMDEIIQSFLKSQGDHSYEN